MADFFSQRDRERSVQQIIPEYDFKKEKKEADIINKENNIKILRKAQEDLPFIYPIEGVFTLIDKDFLKSTNAILIDNVIQNPNLQTSLYSVFLGATKNFMCNTCGLPQSKCPGHLGYINFLYPILNPFFMEVTIRLLNCICPECLEFYVHEDKITKLLSKRDDPTSQKLTILKKASEGEYCKNDNHPKLKYSLDKSDKYKQLQVETLRRGTTSNKNTPKEIKPADFNKVINVLKQLSETPSKKALLKKLLNIEDTRGLYMPFILVIPHYLREEYECKSNIKDSNITEIYKNIIVLNQNFLNNKIKPKKNRKELDIIELYRMEMFNIVNSFNKVSSVSYMTNKKNNITKELVGKKGVPRRFLLAKVDEVVFRMVISPNSDMRLDQVILPSSIRFDITIPVEVTKENFEEVLKLCKEGKVSKIKYMSGEFKDEIRTLKEKVPQSLGEGDIIYRHLMDGDIVIVGRQPTLTITNMMAFVCILKDNIHVMYIHPNVLKAFGGDYDGDEMHGTAPQTLEGQKEAREKLFVTQNMIIPHTGSSTYGFSLGNIVALLLLSELKISKNMLYDCFSQADSKNIKRDETFDENNFYFRCKSMGMIDYRKIPYGKSDQLLIPGFLAFSCLFKSNFYYESRDIYIINGIIVRHKGISKEIKTIMNSYVDQYGNYAAMDILSNGDALLNIYMEHQGFTVSMSDFYFEKPKEGEENINDAIQVLYNKFNSEIAKLEDDKKNSKVSLEKRNIEDKIIAKINSMMSLIYKLVYDVKSKSNNNLITMMLSKAKGSQINFLQGVGAIGQSFYSNARPLQILPYYNNKTKEDYDLRVQGFLLTSYFKGIEAQSYAYASWSAREGAISNISVVPDAGDLSRCLVNSLINIRTRKDGSVWVGKTMLQDIFGGDGLNPKYTFPVEYKKKRINFFVDIIKEVKILNAERGIYDINTKSVNIRDYINDLVVDGNDILEDIMTSGTRQRASIEFLFKKLQKYEGLVYPCDPYDKDQLVIAFACNIISKKCIIVSEKIVSNYAIDSTFYRAKVKILSNKNSDHDNKRIKFVNSRDGISIYSKELSIKKEYLDAKELLKTDEFFTLLVARVREAVDNHGTYNLDIYNKRICVLRDEFLAKVITEIFPENLVVNINNEDELRKEDIYWKDIKYREQDIE